MRRHPARILGPILLGALLLFLTGRAVAGFYTEALWFASTGYSNVFWTRVATELGTRAVTATLAAAVILLHLWLVARRLGPVHVRRRYGNLEISEQIPRRYVTGGIILAAILTGLWLSDVKFGSGQAVAVLTFIKRSSWGLSDPLFSRDLSFYTFNLPVYLQITDFLLLVTGWSLFLCGLGYALIGGIRWQGTRLEVDERPRRHFAVLIALMIALIGIRYWLNRYGILYNGSGFGGGVGYTDVHARLPAHRILAVLSLVTAGAVLYGSFRRTWVPALASGVLLALAAILLGYLYPSAIQKFRVEPNQLGREAAYIRWNLDYTKRAYRLNDIERRSFRYTRSVPEYSDALAQLPVWDADPLLTVFNEVQSTFSYYHFSDVDFDRYAAANGVRQVAVGVREFLPQGLQENARTWQSLHLNPQYLRGLGVVLADAAADVEGNPQYWLHRVPVEVTPDAPAQVALREPAVYFGETMEEYAILNTVLDTTIHALRPQGVRLGSFLRLLAFASRFSEKNLLFSGQLTDSSVILIRRRLDDRLRALAPFILWDRDPQPIIRAGHVVWMIDGYTATPNFPIARPLRVEGAGELRYLRNSVKATVDGVTGETRLYMVDERDPLLGTYSAAFPGLFRPMRELPPELAAHLRYPAFYLRAQADILEEYHLDRAEAFYAGQDVWQLPRPGGTDAAAAPFVPLYAMLQVEPGRPAEFVVAAPFIAQRRRNLTALLMVRNDAPNYGQLVLLEVPRELQAPGPAQVEALAEQDPVISPQLTLWRQAGSDVNLGQVRIVPIDSTFLYVLPVFLAAQGRPIPELQRVIVSDGDRVVMGNGLEDALAGLRGGAPTRVRAPRATSLPVSGNWAQRALELLQAAEAALRTGDWAAYGARQRELRELLQQAVKPPQTPR